MKFTKNLEKKNVEIHFLRQTASTEILIIITTLFDVFQLIKMFCLCLNNY